jgi:hypothetical protein
MSSASAFSSFASEMTFAKAASISERRSDHVPSLPL